MVRRTVQAGPSTSQGWRERAGVLALAGGIVSIVAVYLVLNATARRDTSRDLLPYQALVRTLPEADQQVFRALRQGLLAAEEDRVRQSAWPEPNALAGRGVAPFGDGGYEWSRL